MTTAVLTGRLNGLMAWPRSTAQSEPARRLSDLIDETRRHLLSSLSVRRHVETALTELDEVREEASQAHWDGYGAKPVRTETYLCARRFLELLPTTLPAPEVSADADGDIALDWMFGDRRALTVRIDAVGRCTFAWMRGQRRCRGIDWLDDGVPSLIVDALSRLAADEGSRAVA